MDKQNLFLPRTEAKKRSAVFGCVIDSMSTPQMKRHKANIINRLCTRAGSHPGRQLRNQPLGKLVCRVARATEKKFPKAGRPEFLLRGIGRLRNSIRVQQ